MEVGTDEIPLEKLEENHTGEREDAEASQDIAEALKEVLPEPAISSEEAGWQSTDGQDPTGTATEEEPPLQISQEDLPVETAASDLPVETAGPRKDSRSVSTCPKNGLLGAQ